MQASVHTFDPSDGSGSLLLDDGRRVAFDAEVFGASGLRHVRPGQRVSIECHLDGDAAPVATRLWIVGIGAGETIN